ncbi:TMEM43 family protein [Luteibacter aegosomatis]|uniref:TMEM43 family protein n=1 Tax=Luteibacter aegosomatis TaxID=2911537 RepID=UPI001FFAF200|nr:TMEM43 family protein [Luteibacter aegosomatis]UPG86881.1 TMEM43 family protein [Luteibacter aegosomatis]
MKPGKVMGGTSWAWRIVGVLLLAAALALLFWNEQRVMAYAAAVTKQGAPVIDLGDEGHPSAGQYGAMTRVNGLPRIVDAPHDDEFGIRAQSPLLVRHVEMFQWREITVGGETHYELDWVDHPVESSRFAKPSGHANPATFPIQGRQFEAGEVRLGHFRLSQPVVRAFPGRVVVAPDEKKLPPNLVATFQRAGDYLVTSGKPDVPRLGDLRVSWEAVPLRAMTVLARIDGDTLVPGEPRRNGPGFEVQIGERTLGDVLPSLPEPPGAVMTLRVLAALVASFGLLLMAAGTRFRGDALFALGLGAVVVTATGGVLWLRTDVMASSVWLLVAVLGAGLSIWRSQQRPARDD